MNFTQIQEHRDAIDYTSDDCNDFCDAYLKEMHKLKDDPDTSFQSVQLPVPTQKRSY